MDRLFFCLILNGQSLMVCVNDFSSCVCVCIPVLLLYTSLLMLKSPFLFKYTQRKETRKPKIIIRHIIITCCCAGLLMTVNNLGPSSDVSQRQGPCFK